MKFKVGPASVELIADRCRCCAHERNGGFERTSLAVWAEWCLKGGTVIDVGGYTGLYSIAAAKLGCSVVAFEPNPDCAERFNENAKRNRVRGAIRITEAAASDRNSQGFLVYNKAMYDLTSGGSLHGEKGYKLSVALMKIDLLRLEGVTAIKIDAERHEPQVLAGARETIARNRPHLLVEVLDGSVGRAVMGFAAEMNYELASVVDDRNWILSPC